VSGGVNVKGGEKAVGLDSLIAGGVLVFPSMPNGEIVDLKMICGCH